MGKDNTNEYAVSKETAQCINILKEVISVQERAMSFLAEEGIEDSKEGEAFTENMAKAVKAFSGILGDSIYQKVINGQYAI